MPEIALPLTDTHKQQHDNHLLHKLMLGTGLVTGAIILAPYLLPFVGMGSTGLALDAIGALHTMGLGTGLAGAVNSALNAVPLVGHVLAQGGLVTAITSGSIGIGGVLLGKFLEQKHDGQVGINWGKVIKYGALLTSAFIAFPSVVTGISIGLAYLAAAMPAGLRLADPIPFIAKTLGTNGTISIGKNGLWGIGGILPHLLTCGGALFPALFSAKLAEDKTPIIPSASPAPTVIQQNIDDPVVAKIAVDSPTTANVPVTAKLYLTNSRTGLPITGDELAITHTSKLHLYITDQSLRSYHHVHPEPTNEPGVFTFSFTPQSSNQYNAWVDCTLLKDGSNHRIKTQIPAAAKRNIPAVIRSNNAAQTDELNFDWRCSAPLQKDSASIIEVNVTDKQGKPVADLEPVMGAFAHLAGFSADGKHFIHTHPLGIEPSTPDARGGPTLRFQIEPDYAGPTQFYLQISRNGKDTYVPFGQQIALSQEAAMPFASQRVALAR